MEPTKANLRQIFSEKRKQLNEQYVQDASNKVVDFILNHPIYLKSETIMVYLAFRKEVDLNSLIVHAWKQGKRIVVPKTNMNTKQMEPYAITSWNDLFQGNYGILEPVVSDKYPIPIEQIELVLVPGLAFDQNGYRLGYGGGYYDRFFDRFKKLPYRIGVGYEFQAITDLPFDSHDYKVNEFCTELGCTKL